MEYRLWRCRDFNLKSQESPFDYSLRFPPLKVGHQYTPDSFGDGCADRPSQSGTTPPGRCLRWFAQCGDQTRRRQEVMHFRPQDIVLAPTYFGASSNGSYRICHSSPVAHIWHPETPPSALI